MVPVILPALILPDARTKATNTLVDLLREKNEAATQSTKVLFRAIAL